MSEFSQLGLSIIAEDSLLKTLANRSSAYTDLTRKISRYSHELRAVGGFYSANISFNANRELVNEWVQHGLARHIVVRSNDGVIIFEGFVDKVNVSAGALTYECGPVMDVANKVATKYSTIDNTVSPPIMGNRAITSFSSNTDSQAIYGILEYINSTGGSTATEAEQSRNSYLTDTAWPFKSHDFTLGTASSQSQIILSCLGYWHLLEKYLTYSDTNTGTLGISTKITTILAAHSITGLYSTDYSRVISNTFAVTRYENDNNSALSIIEGLNQLGDTSNRRYNIGIYAGRQLRYEPANDYYEYERRIGSNADYANIVGGSIAPWYILPGKWVFFPDFLVGAHPPVTAATLRSDPRTSYIETLSFTAPRTLAINGKKLGEYDQLMARIGLAGIAA